MIVVQVHVQVKPEWVEEFKQATIENARCSLSEPGVARFDVLQQSDDPTKFVLLEVYRTEQAVLAHKGTPHYKKWRQAVEPWMAAPRFSVRYANVFPEDSSW